MVKKNWAHTINFEDLVKLISDCGAKELRQHLVNGARNATYTSKYTVNKYVIKIDLMTLQKKFDFTCLIMALFYNDELVAS